MRSDRDNISNLKLHPDWKNTFVNCFMVVMVPGLYGFYFPVLLKVVTALVVELFVETAVSHRFFRCVCK